MNDFLNVQKKAVQKTNKTLLKQPISLFLPLVLAILFTLINVYGGSVFRFGILGGFILAFLYAILVSGTMYFYQELVRYNRFNRENISDGWKVYIRSVYSIYFLLMLVEMFARPLGLSLPIMGGLYLLFNPIPEVIYLKGYYGFEAVRYTGAFLKENFLYWFPSLVIYLALNTLLLGVEPILVGIASTNVVNQLGGVSGGLSISGSIFVVKEIFSLLLTGYYMIFRGHLFLTLSTSTKRKREFMGGFYE